LDAEVAKYSNRVEEYQARPAVTKVVEPEEEMGEDSLVVEDETD